MIRGIMSRVFNHKRHMIGTIIVFARKDIWMNQKCSSFFATFVVNVLINLMT